MFIFFFNDFKSRAFFNITLSKFEFFDISRNAIVTISVKFQYCTQNDYSVVKKEYNSVHQSKKYISFTVMFLFLYVCERQYNTKIFIYDRISYYKWCTVNRYFSVVKCTNVFMYNFWHKISNLVIFSFQWRRKNVLLKSCIWTLYWVSFRQSLTFYRLR